MTRDLSRTEREVLRLFGAGRSPRQIAAELGISDTTVLWVIGHSVAERGVGGTNVLASSLTRSRVFWLPRVALPLAAVIVLTLGVAALAKTGTWRGPFATPPPTTEDASPATFAPSMSAEPPRTLAPGAPVTESPALATASPQAAPATAAPLGAPTTALPLPTLAAPLVPSVPLPTPTVAPTLPLPLPSLPTVPPLSTPRPLVPPTAP